MLKKLPKFNKKTVYILLAVAVAFALFQTFLVLKYYEADVFLYAHGTALPSIFNVLLSVFVIGVILYFSLTNCDTSSDSLAECSVATRIFAFLAGAAVLFNGLYDLSVYSKRTSDMLYIAQKQDKFIMWSAVLAFVGFIYFIFCFALPDKAANAKTWLGCVIVGWHIVYLLAVYFDMTNPLNNPIRLMNEFALVGIMMYLTVEIRYLCNIPKKGFYIGTSIVAFTLLSCSSVSNIMFVISGNANTGGNMIIFVYQFFAAGYVLTRLLSQLKSK